MNLTIPWQSFGVLIECYNYSKPLDTFINDFFKIYLFIHEREAETQAEGEKQAPHREPDVGLDPQAPGSPPEPKADAQPLSHTGIPIHDFFV